MGNLNHVLPRGVVCDQCNNYFARKVEAPLLNNPSVQNLRARQGLANKRKRIPPQIGYFLQGRIPIELNYDISGFSMGPHYERDNSKWIQHVLSQKKGSALFPISLHIPKRQMSRLLAKMALEYYAFHFMNIQGFQEATANETQLDDLRRFARIGDNFDVWTFHERKVYGEEDRFAESTSSQPYQVLHEFDWLYTKSNELYFVIIIFGIEYAFNYRGPEIEGYEIWLKKHDNISPLYHGKNQPMPRRILA